MYFSSRTDKTKIIQLQNQVEALQATINSAKPSTSNSELELKISNLLKENESLKEQIELLKKESLKVEVQSAEEPVSEELLVVEETIEESKQLPKLKQNKKKDASKNEL